MKNTSQPSNKSIKMNTYFPTYSKPFKDKD